MSIAPPAQILNKKFAEDGDSAFLQNVGGLILEYIASHPGTRFSFKISFSTPQHPLQLRARTLLPPNQFVSVDVS
jgi:hypothetical protein